MSEFIFLQIKNRLKFVKQSHVNLRKTFFSLRNAKFSLSLVQTIIKGTVSQELSGYGTYCYICINQMLFSRADFTHHKIVILLKGHFTIYKKTIQHVHGSAIPDGFLRF